VDTLLPAVQDGFGLALLWSARLVLIAGALVALGNCSALLACTTMVLVSRFRGRTAVRTASGQPCHRRARPAVISAALGRRRGLTL